MPFLQVLGRIFHSFDFPFDGRELLPEVNHAVGRCFRVGISKGDVVLIPHFFLLLFVTIVELVNAQQLHVLAHVRLQWNVAFPSQRAEISL